MCRLAMFPPNFPREEAIEILQNFAHGQDDGVGYAYIRNDKFVVNKWPIEIGKVLKENDKFLGHMPYDGWTIAHLRAASHGENTMENTHPFLIGDWAFAHNGVWHEYFPVKLTLSAFGIEMKGETDTEVAGNLFNLVGPENLLNAMESDGVFIALNKDGSLTVVKTSGDLEFTNFEDKYLIASELDDRYDKKRVKCGIYEFCSNGKITRKFVDKKRERSFYNRYPHFNRKSSCSVNNISNHGEVPEGHVLPYIGHHGYYI